MNHNVKPSGHSSTRRRQLWHKCPNRRVEHRLVLLLQWLVSLCSWLYLSNGTELLHSKQVWRKLLLGLCARRLNSHEDSYETDLWYSGNNMQRRLDDLFLWTLRGVQDGTRNPHQKRRNITVTRHKDKALGPLFTVFCFCWWFPAVVKVISLFL